MLMPTLTKFQYGTLAFSVDTYRFMYTGGPALGDDYTNKPLYEVFDEVGRDGWEPHVFFQEGTTPMWVMRRPAK